MKIIVIANCQVESIVKLLKTSIDVESVVGIPIHLYGSNYFEKAKQDYLNAINDPDYNLLTFIKNENLYKEFSLDVLRNKHPNLLTMTNIFFSGLHPDITYLGDRGGRIISPLGDYHSKIILKSFLLGLSVESCLDRFNELVYEEMGFFDEFEKSSLELLERDKNIDIAFGSIFMELVRHEPSLYTFNHPTGFVFQEYVDLIGKKIGINIKKFPFAMQPNPLSSSTWWPIYNEIAEKHCLKYRTPLLFKKPDSLGGGVIDLGEFIRQSYRIYANESPRLKQSRQANALSTI
jgi:hypothetical protein